MSTLAARLSEIAEASKKRIPPEKAALMKQATADLSASGILDRTVKVGDTLPAFSLRNSREELVTSEDLLAKGPVVISIFRGSW